MRIFFKSSSTLRNSNSVGKISECTYLWLIFKKKFRRRFRGFAFKSQELHFQDPVASEVRLKLRFYISRFSMDPHRFCAVILSIRPAPASKEDLQQTWDATTNHHKLLKKLTFTNILQCFYSIRCKNDLKIF